MAIKLTLGEVFKIYKLLFKHSFSKKNKLILLGAGAVIDIGGPFTICNGKNISTNCCLTHLVLKCGIRIRPNTSLTLSIYKELQKQFETPNFEDIIDFLENTIISIQYPNHYSYSRYFKFLKDNVEIEITENKVIVNSFCNINIKAKDVNQAYFIILKITLIEVVNEIRKRINVYQNSANQNFDSNFLNWFNKHILYKYKEVSIYSLNYDSYLFNLIAKENKPTLCIRKLKRRL